MNKRIILVGPAAAGKDFIKRKFGDKKFKLDASYTDRSPREGEIDGIDYHFISSSRFFEMIFKYDFYEYIEHGNYNYGTGQYEWDTCDVFIMEPHGVAQIDKDSRNFCLVIYINTPFNIRAKRMKERGWDNKKIEIRNEIDIKKFKDFKDYDIEISSEEHL